MNKRKNLFNWSHVDFSKTKRCNRCQHDRECKFDNGRIKPMMCSGRVVSFIPLSVDEFSERTKEYESIIQFNKENVPLKWYEKIRQAKREEAIKKKNQQMNFSA